MTKRLARACGARATGSGTTSLTITGSLSQVNADLATLTDTDSNPASDTIHVGATDSLGNSATAKSIAVSVSTLGLNIAAPASEIFGAGQAGSVSGVSLSEAGSTSGETFTATLTDTTGLLSATGTGVTGSGTKSLTVTGSLTQVNADLATLKDTTAAAGSDTISIGATDSLGNTATGKTVSVTTNGAPVIAAPTSEVFGLGQTGAISGVSLSESGTTTGETFTATLSDATGLLSATGTGVSGSGTKSLTVTGSLTQVNADLATLKETSSTAGSDTITIGATDSLGDSATAKTIAVTTNGLPVIAAPTTATVSQASATGISGVSLSETGTTAGETFTATLSDTNGLLSAMGTGVSGSGTKSLIVTGSLSQVNADLATLTDTDSNVAADTINLGASDSLGASAAAKSIAVSVTPSGQTFTFTKGTDSFAGGAGNDTFVAASGTLTAGDTADGGGGTNTLSLVGPGVFNLGAPTTLANIEVVTAQEGQPAYTNGATQIPAQNQIVELRDGMNNVTLNVTPATLNSSNPRAATLTVVGANNNDVINLNSGNDVVQVGSAQEVVHGGTGADSIDVTSATIGATIDGGSSGLSQLVVRGGGTLTMGPQITHIGEVILDAAPSAYSFTANGTSGLVVDDLNTLADTIAAGGSGQVLTGGAAGQETMVGFGSGSTTYQDAAATLNGDAIKNFSSADRIDLTGLKFTQGMTTVSFTPASATQGTLDVFQNGVQMAQVTLFGQLAAASFTAHDDGAGGTVILDPPTNRPLIANLAAPPSSMHG